MKIKKVLLFFLFLLFAGCVVQSLTPFYVKDAVVDMAGLNGQWRLVTDRGRDVGSMDVKPWIVGKGTVKTFDEKGVPSELSTVFFRAGDAVFVDVTAYYPDQGRLNRWWHAHTVPVHTVCRVKFDGDRLLLMPLNRDWMEKTAGQNERTIPKMTLVGADLTVYYPSSEEWMKFLQKYSGDKDAFPESGRYELIRSGKAVGEDEEFPPYELIEGNVKSTNITVAVEIADLREREVFKADDDRSGYVVYSIKANVLRRYWGDIEAGGDVVYSYLIEAGIAPPSKGTKHIVSLNKNDKGFVVPDVGYHFKYTDRLDRLYEKAAKDVPNGRQGNGG